MLLHICTPARIYVLHYQIMRTNMKLIRKDGKRKAGRKIQRCTQPNVTTENQPPLKIKNASSPIYLSIKDSAEVIVRINSSKVITSDHVSLQYILMYAFKASAEVIIRIDPSEVITSNHVSLHAMKQ